MMSTRAAFAALLKPLCLIAFAFSLAACGGGGGSDAGGTGNSSGGGGAGGGSGGGNGGTSGATFSVSSNTLAFTAATAVEATPASQTIIGSVTGTIDGGSTLYIVITSTGNAVANVSNVTISDSSGQASVTPIAPTLLGAGTFTGTITVRACLNDVTCATGQLAGSPQNIAVTYNIGSYVPSDTVMPHVVTAGTAGQVVIRGAALSGVTAVNFGSTPATAVTVVSTTEVRASYPATLTPQTLPVTLNGGAISFNGSIVAVGPQAYSAQTLTLPETPNRVLTALYDAERRALFVAGRFAQSGNNKLWRYTYSSSAWTSAPEIIAIPDLRAITFSNDGSRLLALTGYSLQELDPANPGAGASKTISAPFTSGTPYTRFFKQIAFGNDGVAVLSTGGVGVSGYSDTYLYSSITNTFTPAAPTLSLYSAGEGGSPMLTASADGSVVLAAQSGLTPAPQLFQYSPANTQLAPTRLRFNQRSDEPALTDSSASKRLLYDLSTASVYDSNYALLGRFSAAGGNSLRAVAMNRQGTRAYTMNSDNTLHAYDLAAAPVNNNYPEIGLGSPQTVPASGTNVPVRLIVTPDGGTLFLAGDTGIAVIPAPY